MGTVKIGAVQAPVALVDFHLERLAAAIDSAEANLAAVAAAVDRAGAAGCAAAVLTEDTLGVHKWLAAHPSLVRPALLRLVPRLLAELGAVAAARGLHVVCASDALAGGAVYSTAFLIGPDGELAGTYHKVNLPYCEAGSRRRGTGYPVFAAGALGPVGLLVCHDMVFPEPLRCLALAGAGMVFVPTMGVASVGADDLGELGFRMRAADNGVYLVVAYRRAGSMVISPRGELLARGDGELVAAAVDPAGGREGGNAFDTQADFRARLFRERVPQSYGLLGEPQPPVLARLPDSGSPVAITRRAAAVMTRGEDEFAAAETLLRAGERAAARRLFERLCEQYAGAWIERAARQRLATLET